MNPKYYSKAAAADYAANSGQKVTTVALNRSFFNAALEMKIVEAGQRTVYLGDSFTRTEIAEFTLLSPEGFRRTGCQAGRDFTI